MTDQSVRLFISYSHRDEQLRQQLDKHLASLKRQNIINSWHDRKIEAGMNWAKQIDDNLNQADIVLLLISPDFIFSNYCSEIEMQQAIQRHENGEAIVVPIIVEPCDWMWLPFSKYQAFPKNAKPITTWSNINEAFLDVIQGIRTVAQRLFEQRQQKLKEKEIARDRYLKKVEEILSFNGEISIPGQDTLDELREELGLTPEEARELQKHAFEPYKKYQQNLRRYQKTFTKVIQQEYPLSDKTKEALNLRQRDLGIKPDDVKQIESQILILAQVKANNQDKQQEKESQIQQQQKANQNQQLEVENREEKVNISQPTLAVKDDNLATMESKSTSSIVAPIKQLESQPEIVINSIETIPESQPVKETTATLEPEFLESCQQELTRCIGPMAQFILEDTLAEYPQIEPQQLVEVLSLEIPDPQNAKQFREHLLSMDN